MYQMRAKMQNSSHKISPQTIDMFLTYEKEHGADDNMMRRYRRSVETVYAYLPDDKLITKERLVSWRESMEKQGYSSATIVNYMKYVNRYLRHVGCERLQLQRNSSKNLKGMTFGYLTALEIVGQDERKNNIWLCECKCKKTIEVVATLLINGNTRSCGCLYGEHLSKANKNIDHTNLRQSLKDEIVNKENKSGYIGVAPKRDKWQAYITYKGIRYNLGVYVDIKEAVKARTRAKQWVMEDAKELLKYYEEIHRDDPVLPSRDE